MVVSFYVKRTSTDKALITCVNPAKCDIFMFNRTNLSDIDCVNDLIKNGMEFVVHC